VVLERPLSHRDAAVQAVGFERSQPPTTSLELLGGFVLRHAGLTVRLPPSVQRVLAYLALHRGPAARLTVAGTLWPDYPEERANGNLRSALWRLRRLGLSVINTYGDCLVLAPEVDVDLDELVSAARGCIDRGGAPPAPMVDQLASNTTLLNDWYDDWVLVEREHFHQLRLHALERLALEYAAAGLFGRATETALAAVASDPLRESAHRVLIQVHLCQGNQGSAIRQYVMYRRLMRDELELAPSPQIDELMGTLLSHVPG
jgi:DNA-binding SARP family transcriptional activator